MNRIIFSARCVGLLIAFGCSFLLLYQVIGVHHFHHVIQPTIQFDAPTSPLCLEQQRPIMTAGPRLCLSDHNIFFVETAESKFLNPRQACAVESAARHHPAHDVLVLMSPIGSLDFANGAMKVLNSIDNVKVVKVHFASLFKGTPYYDWYVSNVWKKSNYKKDRLVTSSRQLSYMWVDRNGRSVSPPPRSPGYKPTFKKVLVSVEDGLALGLMIRGGAEYRLGIYITGVDEGSAADLAGLQFGDQILSVNEVDFTSITHDEAVRILESSARMSVVVRSEGRVPHSNDPAYSPQATPYAAGPSSSSDGWYQDPMPHRTELSRKGSPRKREHSLDESAVNPGTAERRLDRKARQLLSESQRLTLAYYCNEYETGAMAVHDFVPLLLKLLETTDKQSLLKEIRALVPSKDLGKFDELMYRRELQTRKSKDSMKLSVEIRAGHADDHESPPGEILRNLSPRATFRASTRRRQQDKHHLSVPTSREDMHTPSEDSGVDLPNGTLFPHGSRKGSRVSSASRDSMTLDAKSLQRKPSPSRLWRLSPRGSVGGGTSPRLRRAAFRRHSSGGEGGGGGRAPEDRRWSIGEMVDAPYVEGHLNAARAVLSRLEAIALTQRRRSPRTPPRSPRLSPGPLSPRLRSPGPLSPGLRSPGLLSPSNNSALLEVPHVKVRRHRSLPDPHAIQARKKQQQQLERTQQSSPSVSLPGHRTIPEGNGRFRIIVKKSRPLLGIAIEGGCDTAQPLPRIISIHKSGAAFESGGLKVGHIIMEVDGVGMGKRPHHEVAQLIAHAFYATDRDQVEFVVVETSRELDVRRTSIMLFE